MLIFSFRDVTQLASMLKLKCGRLCREVTDGCLQFWGGMGFTNDVLVSRLYRQPNFINWHAHQYLISGHAKTMLEWMAPFRNTTCNVYMEGVYISVISFNMMF